MFDHVALALPDRGHVYGHQIGCNALRCGVMYQIGYLGAGDFVLGGQVSDVRAGSADPQALHHRRAPP